MNRHLFTFSTGGNHLGFRHGQPPTFEGARKVPLANLFASTLTAVAVPVKKFADSTGPMMELRSAGKLNLITTLKHYWRSDHYGEFSKNVLSRPAIVIAQRNEP